VILQPALSNIPFQIYKSGSGKFIFGDNLEVLRNLFADETVDLIYLDPPFNSQDIYKTMLARKDDVVVPVQITAFEDVWCWCDNVEKLYHKIVTDGSNGLANLLQGFYSSLGSSNLMAYLVIMAERLVDLFRVLKVTGSIYLHCDPKASHYLKLIMDSIFGVQAYRAEIIWKRFSSHGNVCRTYGKIHDILLYYTKSNSYTWNQLYTDLSEKHLKRFRYIEEGTGRRYLLQGVLTPGRDRPNLTYEWNGHTRAWKWTKEKMQQLHDSGLLVYSSSGYPQKKQYLDENQGQALQTLWTDIGYIGPTAPERSGYPTQKPEALLERIISASSNEKDLVLDPFCGSGTTLAVAQKLGRRWIGIDNSEVALNICKERLDLK
jgi:DNA modification methylase